MNELIVRGTPVSQDQDGYLSLTDLWRIAGRNGDKSPSRWQRLPATKDFVVALSQSSGFFRIIDKKHTKPGSYGIKDKDGGSYAHHLLALAYAEFLDRGIGIEVRDIALRCWPGDIVHFDEFMRMRIEEDEKRVRLREEIRWHNQKLAVCCREAGARSPADYAEFHGPGY